MTKAAASTRDERGKRHDGALLLKVGAHRLLLERRRHERREPLDRLTSKYRSAPRRELKEPHPIVVVLAVRELVRDGLAELLDVHHPVRR